MMQGVVDSVFSSSFRCSSDEGGDGFPSGFLSFGYHFCSNSIDCLSWMEDSVYSVDSNCINDLSCTERMSWFVD